MDWVISLLSLGIFGTIALGLHFRRRPPAPQGWRRWLFGILGLHLLVFLATLGALLVFALQTAMAAPVAEGPREISLGLALALFGIGLPTIVGSVAAAIAVSRVGSAALAVLAEKPELFGRTLVYLGLAEGIAIYGLIVTLLMLDKI
jgi:V/A-type H+-transporting ATPase subunit K